MVVTLSFWIYTNFKTNRFSFARNRVNPGAWLHVTTP